jgi:hypothetical protein
MTMKSPMRSRSRFFNRCQLAATLNVCLIIWALFGNSGISMAQDSDEARRNRRDLALEATGLQRQIHRADLEIRLLTIEGEIAAVKQERRDKNLLRQSVEVENQKLREKDKVYLKAKSALAASKDKKTILIPKLTSNDRGSFGLVEKVSVRKIIGEAEMLVVINGMDMIVTGIPTKDLHEKAYAKVDDVFIVESIAEVTYSSQTSGRPVTVTVVDDGVSINIKDAKPNTTTVKKRTSSLRLLNSDDVANLRDRQLELDDSLAKLKKKV